VSVPTLPSSRLDRVSAFSDNPIRDVDEDRLERAPLAASFSNQVLKFDLSEGLVVGVLGPWGSGKTSFVNLAKSDLQKRGATVLAFNPWMFSGADQLVESFFAELSSELKVRPGLGEIGDDLAEYGEAFSGLGWLPLVGPWVERGRWATKVLAQMLRRRRGGTGERRAKLHGALQELESPIVVVLDDIDRLSTDEIRAMFKLVRLTASFPNVIYMVAFDRGRVETALGEQGIRGRDYLEKILQTALDLPLVPVETLRRQIFETLDQTIAAADYEGQVDGDVWPDVFAEIIAPLIRNIRDLKRYAATIGGTLEQVGTKIALADLLALEAARVFLPDVFAQMRFSVQGLCTPSQFLAGGARETPALKEEVERLVAVADQDHGEVVRAFVQRLFPFGARHLGGGNYGPDFQKGFLRDRRVGHEAVLRLYLERVAGEQLTNFYDAERAWKSMEDRDAFDAVLRSLDPERCEDVIAALETYEDEYRPNQVVPGTVVLWNLHPELPQRPQGMFSFGTRIVVGRVAYRLLRSLADKDAVAEAVAQILPELTTLSSKWEVITDVGYRENAGHKLVSEQAAKGFEREWRAELRAASPSELASEHNLALLFYFARRDAADDEPGLAVPPDPEVTLAIIKGATSEARSQYMGTRSIRRELRISWNTLVEVYGDEATLKARVDALKSSDIDFDADLEELVGRYLSGWRPDD
jgi:hypothetical protein